MIALTVARRVMATFALLITIAVVEVWLVRQVNQEARRAFAEATRTLTILHEQDEARRAVVAMQAAQRGYVITGSDGELALFEQYGREYEAASGRLASLIRDPEQVARYRRLQELVADWRSRGAAVIIEARRQGADASALLQSEAIPRFRRIEEEFGAFDRRQVLLTEQSEALAGARISRATLILTLGPALSGLVLIALVVETRRVILEPLAALSASARRLAGGDYAAPLPDVGRDEVGALVAAFRDMRTAVEDRTTALSTAHAELLDIVNAVPVPLLIMQADRTIRLQNRAAERLLGALPARPEERAANLDALQITDGAGHMLPVDELPPVRALRGAPVQGEEIAMRRPDGEHATLIVSAAPIRDARGEITGVVAAFQDISRLRELDRMKDEFVSIVSHELRTPLTAIKGALQLLVSDAASVPDPGDRQLLEVALKSSDRLVRIINDILDVSKIEAGKLRLARRRLPVADVIAHSVDDVRTVAAEAGVRLVISVAPGLPEVLGDADRLTQVIVNLLSNAVKFAPPGTEVVVGAERDGPAVILRVADRGPGIAPEDVPRLFQKFQQLDASHTRRAGGTGLGLTISKAIVEEHGGSIGVDSRVGEGTTFVVRLPAADAAAPRTDAGDAVAAEGAAPAAEDGAPIAGTVLLAEDDEDVRFVLREALQRIGCRVVEVADGREALRQSRLQQFDAVVVDLHIPFVHGHDVIRALREPALGRRVPIVAISGSEGEQQRLESLVLGASVFMAKPADPAQLAREVQRLLRG